MNLIVSCFVINNHSDDRVSRAQEDKFQVICRGLKTSHWYWLNGMKDMKQNIGTQWNVMMYRCAEYERINIIDSRNALDIQ